MERFFFTCFFWRHVTDLGVRPEIVSKSRSSFGFAKEIGFRPDGQRRVAFCIRRRLALRRHVRRRYAAARATSARVWDAQAREHRTTIRAGPRDLQSQIPAAWGMLALEMVRDRKIR